MLLTVTDDRLLSQKIRELCALSGMFSYIRGFNDATTMTNLPKAITSILIDGRFSKQNVRELYAFVMDNCFFHATQYTINILSRVSSIF